MLLDPCDAEDRQAAQAVSWLTDAKTSERISAENRQLLQSEVGARAIIDRWFNPTDLIAHRFAMYSLDIAPRGEIGRGSRLKLGTWHELRFEWDSLAKRAQHACRFFVDGKRRADLPLNRTSRNGVSYVQLISTAADEDTQGFLVESVRAEAQ